MPPLLCGSPCILDQSFPRDDRELHMVADVLGEIEELLAANRIHLILTTSLADLVLDINWQARGHQYALLSEIYRLLNLWFLQPHDRVIQIDTAHIVNHVQNHPLPVGINNDGWATLWAEEIGKLLALHDMTCRTGFCVGIACEHAFTSRRPNRWQGTARAFPLVGPDQIDQLEDAYEWEPAPEDLHQKLISLTDAKRNVHLLGATAIDSCDGDSHYKVHFPGSRPWLLDVNVDPVPERFVKQLEPITGFPYTVIKTALVFGYMPQKNVLRLRASKGPDNRN